MGEPRCGAKCLSSNSKTSCPSNSSTPGFDRCTRSTTAGVSAPLAPNPYVRDWVVDHLTDLIQEAIEQMRNGARRAWS